MPPPSITAYPRRTTESGILPRISIVTSVKNAEKTLNRTIESVRSQDIDALEYIVVDAVSSDRTIDIIESNTDIITVWKSEADSGISDGFNKGVALARGKYVMLLNADDWLSPNQLSSGMETLEKTGADFVFGDLVYHYGDSGPVHIIRGEEGYGKRIAHVMPGINHPTVIVRRSAYERNGLFDLSLRYAMDYEFLLRLHRAGCKGVYDPRIVGHMALDGASDRNTGAALREVRDVSINYGYPRTLAWLRYGFRLLKWRGRLLLAILPPSLFTRLRRIFNRNYVATK